MLHKHRLVIHLVDVIAREDHEVLRSVAVDDVDVLEHRVGRAGVPLVLGDALTGRQDVETLVAHRLQKIPAALQVPDQAVGFELRGDRDAPNAGVECIRQREVDDARLTAEIDGRFGSPLGELHQPATPSAREHVGHRGTGQRLRVGQSVHSDPDRCMQFFVRAVRIIRRNRGQTRWRRAGAR